MWYREIIMGFLFFFKQKTAYEIRPDPIVVCRSRTSDERCSARSASKGELALDGRIERAKIGAIGDRRIDLVVSRVERNRGTNGQRKPVDTIVRRDANSVNSGEGEHRRRMGAKRQIAELIAAPCHPHVEGEIAVTLGTAAHD